jgi:hypothetical protein
VSALTVRIARLELVILLPEGAMHPMTLEDALAILGEDVLDLDSVQEFFHIRLSDFWRARLRGIPFERKVLERRRNTHILFAGAPLSVLDLRERARHCFDRLFWYARDQFARDETVELRWYLLRKDVVPGSMGKAFTEQVALLDEREEVPRACKAVYGITLYFLARGVRLFANTCARCIDIASSSAIPTGARIDLGDFNETGLGIALWDDKPDESIGLASMVMPIGTKKQKSLQR